MLTIQSKTGSRDCQGNTRRDFLKAGFLGLGGLTLPWLLEQKAHASESPGFVRDKAIVLIFCGGGASHIETFNPNMGAPAPFCSVTGEVLTPVPGITLGGTFPRLAQHARNMAIVKSFRHPIGNHEQAISHVLTGGTDTNGQAILGHSMGAMYTRLRGTNHPETGMPTYALLTHPHTDPQYSRELQRVVSGSRGGTLGPTFNPFNPAGGGTTLENMLLNVPAERLTDRRRLLDELDRIRRGSDSAAARERLGEYERQAVDLLLGGAGRALDLSREDPRIVQAYDTSMFMTGKRTFDRSQLGQQMLLARRLVEAGAGFITVQSAGWDNHADGNNPGIVDGMNMLGPPLDKALSAFLTDLECRGLSDKVLTVVTGDFGRTPTINRNGGRDHWASLCTLAFFGGGLRMGQVIGQSDRQNRVPASAPIGPGNLLSTIMHTLFDVGQLRVARGVPSTLSRLIEDHRPIGELLA
ncbi:MAG: DUF1501 domain-containing protein [Gemmataceae bacterium]|nr:DUF1501 domain-containing protein [Gemmataceae bacterium]